MLAFRPMQQPRNLTGQRRNDALAPVGLGFGLMTGPSRRAVVATAMIAFITPIPFRQATIYAGRSALASGTIASSHSETLAEVTMTRRDAAIE